MAIVSADKTNERDLTVLSLGEVGEIISGSAYILGQVAGLEDAKAILLGLAGNAFARHDDTRARILREIADEIETAHKQKRQFYDTTERPRSEAAFQELDRREKYHVRAGGEE